MIDKLIILIQRITEYFGFRVYRIGTHRIKMREALLHIKNMGFEPSTVIDVGVAYGTPDLYKIFPSVKYLLIEPLEEYRETLKEIATQINAEISLSAAAAHEGTATLHVAPILPGSSLFTGPQDDLLDVQPRTVPMTTLDIESASRNLSPPYLIKIDTQGSEIEVLKGAQKILQETEVVILEAFFFEFYEKAPQFDEVVAFMKDLGFVIYDLFDLRLRHLDAALAQADIAFVKENGMFRKQNLSSTPDQYRKLAKSMRSINIRDKST